MKKVCTITILVLLILLSSCGKNNFESRDFSLNDGNTSENLCQGGIMTVYEDYIYLPQENGILEIDKHTGEAVPISVLAEFGYINVIENYLFYNSIGTNGDREGLVVQSLDKKFKKQLSDKRYFPFVVHDNFIYATNIRGGDLYRINLKTLETTMLVQAPVEEFIINGNQIFYNDGTALFSLDCDGTHSTKLISDITLRSVSYNEKENALVFVITNDDNFVYRYDLSESRLTCVRQVDCKFVRFFMQTNLVILKSDNTLELFSLIDNSSTIIASNVSSFQIFNEELYFFDYDGNMFLYENNKSQIIYSPNIS